MSIFSSFFPSSRALCVQPHVPLRPDLVSCNIGVVSTSLIITAHARVKRNATTSHFLISLSLCHHNMKLNTSEFSIRSTMKPPRNSAQNPSDTEMSNDPTDTPANEADGSEQQASNGQALTSRAENLIDLPDSFFTFNMDQALADFHEHLNSLVTNGVPQNDMNGLFGPSPELAVDHDHALQAYLIQMQLYAGIPRRDLQPMGPRGPWLQQPGFINSMRFQNGEFWPIREPSASFTGRLAPLFDQSVIPPDFRQRFNLGRGIQTDGVSSMPFF